MKKRVITYSASVLNKVVRVSMDLTPINGSVFYTLSDKHPTHEQMDGLSLVLRTADTYFVYTEIPRKMLSNEAFIASATDVAEHFEEHVEQLMERGKFLQLLYIEVCKELDMDPAPLMAYRQERQRRRQELERQKQQEQQQRQERQRQEAFLANRQRLSQEKARLMGSQMIATSDFLALCRQEGVAIPSRTMGVFLQRTDEVSFSHIRCHNGPRGHKPDLRGCFRILQQYRDKNCCVGIVATGAPSGQHHV